MVSIWWVVAAFVIGGYAGAVLVALMSMAGGTREHARVQRHVQRHVNEAARPRGEVTGRRRHAAAVGMHP